MVDEENRLKETAGKRLFFQKNYEAKIRSLVETRIEQCQFNAIQRNAALKSIDALLWKLTAAGIHLERLWEFKETAAMNSLLKNVKNNISEPKRFTDKEVCYLTAEFEAYLMQARALISVAQIHTLDACRVSFGGILTNEKYEKAVKTAPPDVNNRLVIAYNYFLNEIFGSGKWGSLLRSLRDRVVHFDRIRPSSSIDNEDEQLRVAGLTLEQLAQDFENGSHSMFLNVIAPIWEREWISGSYSPGMWK